MSIGFRERIQWATSLIMQPVLLASMAPLQLKRQDSSDRVVGGRDNRLGTVRDETLPTWFLNVFGTSPKRCFVCLFVCLSLSVSLS